MGKRRGREGWAEVIAAWRASGLALAVFCRERGLDYGSCQRWKQRLARTENQVDGSQRLTLIPVGTLGVPETGSVAVVVGRHRIELRGAFDAAVLRRAVAALSSGVEPC